MTVHEHVHMYVRIYVHIHINKCYINIYVCPYLYTHKKEKLQLGKPALPYASPMCPIGPLFLPVVARISADL